MLDPGQPLEYETGLFARSYGLRIPYRVICWPLKDQSIYFMAANSVFLTSVLRLAITSCFTKAVPCSVENVEK